MFDRGTSARTRVRAFELMRDRANSGSNSARLRRTRAVSRRSEQRFKFEHGSRIGTEARLREYRFEGSNKFASNGGSRVRTEVREFERSSRIRSEVATARIPGRALELLRAFEQVREFEHVGEFAQVRRVLRDFACRNRSSSVRREVRRVRTGRSRVQTSVRGSNGEFDGSNRFERGSARS